VKRQILGNSVPAVVGGGTVSYVTPEDHCYLEDHERREEGGTPAIVESIRAGLVFKLQQAVGTEEIEGREADYVRRALKFFRDCPTIEILGDPEAPRLSIMSLRFKHGEKDLHYGFVVSLLNDLFGIQVRGGCSCAGPYGHSLLAMNMEYSRAIESEIQGGASILRPGWVRLNFNYFIDEAEFQYLLDAIALVAEHGWRILPYYHFDPDLGVWRYQGRSMDLPANINAYDFLQPTGDAGPSAPLAFDGLLAAGREELLRADREGKPAHLELHGSAETLRWFVLPQTTDTAASRALRPER
jgi:hypothetical protein